MATLESVARRQGMKVRRSRGTDRVWLVRDGRLFSPVAGHDEATARALLAADRSPSAR